MAASPTGRGYWFVASDGGIFAFGDARFFGSTGGAPPGFPVTGMAATPDGRGYWLVTLVGQVYAFGDASYEGNAPLPIAASLRGIVAAPGGYRIVDAAGNVFVRTGSTTNTLRRLPHSASVVGAGRATARTRADRRTAARCRRRRPATTNARGRAARRRRPTSRKGTAARPNARVSDQSMWPSQACTIVPGTASAAASASDVPSARRTGMCNTFMNSGARRKPPLLPSRPETNAGDRDDCDRPRCDSRDVRARFVVVVGPAACTPSSTRSPSTKQDHVGREHERPPGDPAGEEARRPRSAAARRAARCAARRRSMCPARA